MALLKLDFLPGVNKENTPYSQEGGWVDSDKIRFRSGKPEKIGGWDKYVGTQMLGVPRGAHVWRTLDGTIYTAFATNKKVYIETGGLLTDVTPVRYTSTQTNPIATTNGSAVITITDVAHGANDGAYVTISGVLSAVNGIPAAEINAEHVLTYVDSDTYTITVTTTATSTGSGGGGVDFEYQINPKSTVTTYQAGWGACVWQADAGGSYTRGWGRPCQTTYTDINPRTWSLQNWGEDLAINAIGLPVYLWDATTPTTRATQIEEAPHKVNHVVVTKDRHMVCFGCNSPGVSGSATDLDTMQIRWCSQEDYTDWTPTATNTAGDKLLTNGTQILAAANTESQVMVWTDDEVQSMQFIGPPYTFGFQQIGTSTGIVSPNAWVSYNNVMYWMGDSAFYVYAGGTNVHPCTVQKYVFDGLSAAQKRKTFAALDRENHEITWFYPTSTDENTELNGALNASDTTVYVATTASFPYSGSIQIDEETIDYTGKTDAAFTGCTRGARSTTAAAHADAAVISNPDLYVPTEPCRYVSFGLIDQLWWIGRMERTSWVDRGALQYPIATTAEGYAYNHEKGYDADGQPLVSFIESADFDLSEGDSMMFISRVVPDFTITGSIDLKMRSRYYPLSSQVNEVVGTVTNSTTKIDTRIRGRQMALRIESDDTGDYWKYGATRIDQRTDGKR